MSTYVAPSASPVTPPDERPLSYPGWSVAFGGGVGVFFAALVVVTFPVLLKPWATEFGWSRLAVATAFAIAAAVAAACAGPLGLALDRIGPRRIVVPGLALLGLAFASLATLPASLPRLYLTFALLGLAGIATSPVAYARAVSTWFRSRRGMALAIVITGGAIGGMLHPPLIEALSRSIGWRGACLSLGIAVLMAGVPIAWRFVRERPRAATDAHAAVGASVRDGLRSRPFWILVAALLVGTMAQNSVIVHLSALLTDRGVSPAQAAIALSAMALAAVIGRLVTGVLIDRGFAARVLVVLMALAAAGAWLLAGADSLALGIVAAVLVGFGTGGEADVVPYLLSRYYGLRSFSALYGLAWMAGAIGGGVGPIAMGRAFDAGGSYAPVLARLALVLVAAAALVLALPRDARGSAGER
jgi:predicted MFS family arabinose efflux permease